ncbi:T10O24.13 [Arabidopsis thaliana]|nr:T10O24.13 [Arabidopsis thaliana]
MAAKRGRNRSPSPDPEGMFAGMVVFMVEIGVQRRRLQIWKQKLVQMGAVIEEDRVTKKVTHVLAMNLEALLHKFGKERLSHFTAVIFSTIRLIGYKFYLRIEIIQCYKFIYIGCSLQRLMLYQWLEDSLTSGEKANEDLYVLKIDSEEVDKPKKSLPAISGSEDQSSPQKRTRYSPDAGDFKGVESHSNTQGSPDSPTSCSVPSTSASPGEGIAETPTSPQSESTSVYKPPDLNRNITEIFGKLINIYRGTISGVCILDYSLIVTLGEDRRSFSYYKAIPVIEKFPTRIESVDQLKHLPGIGKAMRDHIQEIVTTGKLSKLEHFETDEKVRTISLFGEVWGVGPATALKLYEKGHRTLEDLKNEDSLTHAQKLGLKYFDDIKTRIPRQEVRFLNFNVNFVCLYYPSCNFLLIFLHFLYCRCKRWNNFYRESARKLCLARGKATCGDLDIVVTHPDGQRKELSGLVKDKKDNTMIDSAMSRDIYSFGLIAWTGNDVLNRRLRLLAESKGYRLDDTGLFPATHSSSGNRGARGTASLKLSTEKQVFDFLGFPWLEPHERNL